MFSLNCDFTLLFRVGRSLVRVNIVCIDVSRHKRVLQKKIVIINIYMHNSGKNAACFVAVF